MCSLLRRQKWRSKMEDCCSTSFTDIFRKVLTGINRNSRFVCTLNIWDKKAVTFPQAQ